MQKLYVIMQSSVEMEFGIYAEDLCHHAEQCVEMEKTYFRRHPCWLKHTALRDCTEMQTITLSHEESP